MKLFITTLLAIALLAACKNKPETEAKEQQENTIPADHEDFNTFFAKFKADSNFQKSRIAFPIYSWVAKYDMTEAPEGRENDMIVADTFNLTEYSFINFENATEREYDRYEHVLNYYGDSAEVTMQGIDNGISVVSHFKLINGNWYLVKFLDYST
jgi:hypothetical protein